MKTLKKRPKLNYIAPCQRCHKLVRVKTDPKKPTHFLTFNLSDGRSHPETECNNSSVKCDWCPMPLVWRLHNGRKMPFGLDGKPHACKNKDQIRRDKDREDPSGNLEGLFG